MTSKNKFISLAILSLAIFLSPLIVAATTMSVPVTDGNYSTTLALAVTVDGNGAFNMSNVSCFYNSAGGAATTVLAHIVNTTASQTSFTSSVDISSFTDLRTYNVSCQIWNMTTLNKTLSAIRVTFDKTDPVILLDVLASGESQPFGEIMNYKCGLSDAVDTTLATQSFVAIHPSGDDLVTTTLTRNKNDFLQFTDTDYVGDFVFECNATDSAGNQNSKTATVTMNELGKIKSISKGASGNNKLIWLIIAGVGVYFLFFRKK